MIGVCCRFMRRIIPYVYVVAYRLFPYVYLTCAEYPKCCRMKRQEAVDALFTMSFDYMPGLREAAE
ncbi:MAG: hypothetical protein Kow0077_06740 [Anaerolineae bacterium]